MSEFEEESLVGGVVTKALAIEDLDRILGESFSIEDFISSLESVRRCISFTTSTEYPTNLPLSM